MIDMQAKNAIKRLYVFFRDGFREMTTGRTLWIVVLVKLLVLFAILKPFFFPNTLKNQYDNDPDRSEHVGNELTTNPVRPHP